MKSPSSFRSVAKEEEEEEEEEETLDNGTSKETTTPLRKRHGARNQHKMKYFIRWLLQTFPVAFANVKQSVLEHEKQQQQQLQKEEAISETTSKDGDDGDGDRDDDNDKSDKGNDVSSFFQHPLILDVAGGKGELVTRLCFTEHQRVVLVDPRCPVDLVDCYEMVVVKQLPQKWQARLRQRQAVQPNALHQILESRCRQLSTYFDHTTVTTTTSSSTTTTTTTTSTTANTELLQAAVQNAELIIGMHADSATEAIVDLALANRTPFVVVPCCVFPNFFPHRRLFIRKLRDGEDDDGDDHHTKSRPVRSYEDFCDYLLQKDERLQKSLLPFEGRNVAIWWDGSQEKHQRSKERGCPTEKLQSWYI